MKTMKEIVLSEIARMDIRVQIYMQSVFEQLTELNDSDLMQMMTLALAYDDVVKSYDVIEKEGRTTTQRGQLISHPLYKVIAQSLKQVNVISREYGLGRASDKSLKIADKKIGSAENEDSALLRLLKNDNTDV